jgi:hypothetical protein
LFEFGELDRFLQWIPQEFVQTGKRETGGAERDIDFYLPLVKAGLIFPPRCRRRL